MGRGVLLHTYITYGERLGATRGLHIQSRDFKPSGRQRGEDLREKMSGN